MYIDSTGVTKSYSVFLVKTVTSIRTGVCKMAISMTLKADHIRRHALRHKTLTRSDLEGSVLLRDSKLGSRREEPPVLSTLSETWFGRSWVGFRLLLWDNLSVLDRLISPL